MDKKMNLIQVCLVQIKLAIKSKLQHNLTSKSKMNNKITIWIIITS